MKKSNSVKVLSALTGASVLLSGCAQAPVQPQATPPVQPAQPAGENKQSAAPAARPVSREGEDYASSIGVEIFVAESKPVAEVPNVQGEFSFNQDVLTPADTVFNLFGTAVTAVCSSPAAQAIVPGEKDSWSISVSGDVKNQFTASLSDLAGQNSQTRTMACACANNPAGGSLIANARVTGIPLRDVIELAGIGEGVNTVSVIGDDGYAQPMPLSYVLDRDALLVYQIGGEDIPAAQGNPVQLWMPSSVAKYFTRRVTEVRLTREPEAPALLTDAPGEGEFVNRPNIGIVNYAGGETFQAGVPVTFEGYADDYDKAIARVEFSMDGGKTWTPFETAGATSDKWVYWYFTYTPEAPGSYSLEVRSVAADGSVSPLSSIMNFDVV